ncbi:MAG: GAF domain-containing protein [Phototrophicaceae bacterium]
MQEDLRYKIEAHLKILVHNLGITSVWLLQYDFEKHVSLATAHYIDFTANLLEQTPDNGEEYPEVDPNFIAWLQSKVQVGYTLHVDELDRSDPDWLDYVEKGLESVSYMPIFVDNKPWGYVECWETRKKRIFTEEDFDIVKASADQISHTMMTHQQSSDISQDGLLQ